MVAFKEEFPYLRTDSGQLFEFNRDWLQAAIGRAANEAGYPSWWLTDHVTESIAFYLHLRNDESVVAGAAAYFHLLTRYRLPCWSRLRARVL
jgi:hypothetical protein